MPRLVHPDRNAEPEPSKRGVPYVAIIRVLVYLIIALALVILIMRTVQDL